MAVRLITYDLKNEANAEDYKKLLKKIRAYPWAKLSESSYAISTSKTVLTIYDELKEHLDKNDHLYVITLTNPRMGYHAKAVRDWLEKYLPRPT